MPAGRRQQTNTMLYPLVIFVVLFAITTVLAVVFYLKSEDKEAERSRAQAQLDRLATQSEQSKMAIIVGEPERGGSLMGALVQYHDEVVGKILGAPMADASARIKTAAVSTKIQDALKRAGKHISVDPNTGLIAAIDRLDIAVTAAKAANDDKDKQLAQSQVLLQDTVKASQAKEKELEAEKEQYHRQALDITRKYEETRASLEQSSDERAKGLLASLDTERAEVQRLGKELSTSKAELDLTGKKLSRALDQLRAIEPVPGRELACYDPDGRITLANEGTGIVYLDLGRKDRVYQGLTFTVYQRGVAIPKDGKGKGQVEIFSIDETSSTARITIMDKRNPIGSGDLIANLIWDRDDTKHFVVVGSFDFDQDGTMDSDGLHRVTDLITKWGGVVGATVTADTDAIILGDGPKAPVKPSPEDLSRNPGSEQTYAAAQRQNEIYQDVQRQAKALMIPIFTFEKFQYLIGQRGRVHLAGGIYH